MNYEVFSVSFSIVSAAAIALAIMALTIYGAIEVIHCQDIESKERI